jgi:hypothetical protein
MRRKMTKCRGLTKSSDDRAWFIVAASTVSSTEAGVHRDSAPYLPTYSDQNLSASPSLFPADIENHIGVSHSDIENRQGFNGFDTLQAKTERRLHLQCSFCIFNTVARFPWLCQYTTSKAFLMSAIPVAVTASRGTGYVSRNVLVR